MVDCPVTKAWKILGKPWRLVIIDRLLESPKTYNELLNSMHGISTRTLSKSLKELKLLGIIDRVCDGEKYYYALTDAGRDLKPIVKSVKAWSEKWLMKSEQ
jgi:DNA-binding HxlR family transcriptional regulator